MGVSTDPGKPENRPPSEKLRENLETHLKKGLTQEKYIYGIFKTQGKQLIKSWIEVVWWRLNINLYFVTQVIPSISLSVVRIIKLCKIDFYSVCDFQCDCDWLWFLAVVWFICRIKVFLDQCNKSYSYI